MLTIKSFEDMNIWKNIRKFINRIYILNIEKICCYLVFFSAFFKADLLYIEYGLFSLYPYRVFLVLLWLLFVIHILNEDVIFIDKNIKYNFKVSNSKEAINKIVRT